jgi:hypothetical protein
MSERREPRERWPIWLVVLVAVSVVVFLSSCCFVALAFPM